MSELLPQAARRVDERFCELFIRAGCWADLGHKNERALGRRSCPVLERLAEDGVEDSALLQYSRQPGCYDIQQLFLNRLGARR